MKRLTLILVILAVGIFMVLGFGLTIQQDDSICDPSESIDCADCTFPPLDMSQKQIVMSSSTPARIYQFKCLNGTYENTWVSEITPAHGIRGISVGDADNDGIPDITAVVQNGGRGKKFVKIYMYKHGSQGAPDYVGPDLGRSFFYVKDSIIADADNDGRNELIVEAEDSIKIFRWDGSDFINIWNSRKYPSTIFSVDVGDADNDGSNEIVLAAFYTDSAVILESLGNDEWGNEQMTEPIPEEYYGPGFTWLGIDYAKVRDADNIEGNEIVAGGNNNRLMIWKYNAEGNEEYDLVFISQDLGGFTQGVDTGDIDGDDLNEVLAIDSDYTNDLINNVYRFDYDVDSYDESTIFSHNYVLGYMALGNIDSDQADEIVLNSDTLLILDNGSLLWEFPHGGRFEIWEETNPVEPDSTPPAKVEDLTAISPTSSSIDLTWTAPGDDGTDGTASHYDIRYSTSWIEDDTNWEEANQCSGEPSPSAADSTESFTVTGLSPNTFYYFALKTADEALNWSYLSNNASETTLEATPLDAPTGLTAKQPGKAPKVGLEWNDNSTNEEGFRIYRDGVQIAELGPNTTSYEDSTILSNTTYTYQVCAYKGNEQACSNTVSITTK